jgi:hypothetical protein
MSCLVSLQPIPSVYIAAWKWKIFHEKWHLIKIAICKETRNKLTLMKFDDLHVPILKYILDKLKRKTFQGHNFTGFQYETL